MKIGNIVTTNSKGQLVIPAAIRAQLGITDQVPLQLLVKGNALYILPIKDVVTINDTKSSLLQLLEKTQGAWGPATKKELSTEKERHQLELKAAEMAKKAW